MTLFPPSTRAVLLVFLTFRPMVSLAQTSYCDHWRPWVDLIAPTPPDKVLRALAARQKSLYRRESVPKERRNRELCQYGYLDQTGYQLRYRHKTKCPFKANGLTHFRTVAQAKKRRGPGYENNLSFVADAEHISPERLLVFFERQLALLFAGLHGWESAFPHHAASAKKYTQIKIVKSRPISKTLKHASLRIGWAPQKMGHLLPSWSSYLLGLASLFKANFRIQTKAGDSVATATVDSLDTAIDIDFYHTKDRIAVVSEQKKDAVVALIRPTDLKPISLRVFNDVLVNYAGLTIFLEDVRFDIEIERRKKRVDLFLRFVDVGKLDVGGSYRGLGSQSFNKAVRDIVKREIEKNIRILKKSNNGKSASVQLVLKERLKPKGHDFTVEAKFFSPLNVVRALRPRTSYDLDYFSPRQAASKEFARWSRDSVAALIKDADILAKKHQLCARKN